MSSECPEVSDVTALAASSVSVSGFYLNLLVTGRILRANLFVPCGYFFKQPNSVIMGFIFL